MGRDQWCVFCGATSGLQIHHRRIKGMGGSRGGHVDCPCNLVVLCRLCHDEAHNDRLWSEALGYVIPRFVEAPGELSIAQYSGDRVLPVRRRPTCEGGWAA